MSYSKEQFIEDFKNAYNQSQQLHYLYRYLKEYEGQIASVNVEKLEETDSVAYYQFSFTLDNGNVIETDSIAFASYTFVNELDNRVISINNTITSINNTITSLDRRISNNEGDIVDINDKMLTLPNTAPSTRKVVTIDTNGAQDNVDETQLTTLMYNIVDSHGNPRFVEGDISVAGFTTTYAKWSLSGTHLMIMICGTLASGSTLPADTIASINIPSYIGRKINTVAASIIEIKETKAYTASFNELILTLQLRKNSDTNLYIRNSIAKSTEDNRNFRIQFDLLIDAD